MSFDEKVRTLRDKYLLETGYSTDSYTAPRFSITVGSRVFTIRNPGMVQYHDLHHVVTGYGTGLVGEAQVSAFELRAGYHKAIILLLCLGAVGIGLLISPGDVVRAWKAARGASSLYDSPISYDELLDMDVNTLRASINVPIGGFQ